MTKLKDLLLENPDTLVLKTPGSDTRYINYNSGEYVAVTGLIFSDPVAGTEENYIALVDDPEIGEQAVIELHNPELNAKAFKILTSPTQYYNSYQYITMKRVILDVFVSGAKGHGSLEDFTNTMFDHLYKVEGKENSGWGHYEETWRFRIFIVDKKRYFTIWQSSIEMYKRNLPLFVKIVKDCGMNPDEIFWEVRTDESGDERVKLVKIHDLHKLMGTEMVAPETQSEIQKRISELSKKLAEMESDEHVKGATWSSSEKRRHKIDMININAEIEALSSASKSGEKEIKNVIIKTIDSLSDGGDEVIPANILYAELEKKLSQYGTSAVAIIRNLRDRGIDIKKALREINEKFGGKANVTELLNELSKYMNEKTSSTSVNESEDMALVQTGTINRFKETATTPEAFLRIFSGHTLQDLLDKLSFSRLYVMNKFGDMRGDDPQQKFVWMLDHALAYINYRLIMPHRKKVDDAEAEDNARPDVIAYKKKRAEVLKQSFAARRDGDEARAEKLRRFYYDMEEPKMSRYGDNMKTMETDVKKIHSTPLSIEDVTPSPNDTDRDKKSYQHYVESFNEFKGSQSSI